ncbi:MAG: hypothetical protein KC503_24045 [Myxococcales bacterium]|nr:hypothetical protein [Myxococcales bacterium]
MTHRIASLILMAALLGACDTRTTPSASDSTSSGDGASNVDTAPGIDGGSAPDLAPGPDHGLVGLSCVVATRTDVCCPVPRAAAMQDLAVDPCLVPYPAKSGDVTAACQAKRPDCSLVDCAPADAPSRVAKPVNGSCAFVDECATAADCAVALDFDRTCCVCPQAVPRALLAQKRCLQEIIGSQWPSAPSGCEQLPCGAACKCAPPPTLRCETDGDALARCAAAP